MKKTKDEIIQELMDIFCELYDGTRDNVLKLDEDNKEWLLPRPGEDEDNLDVYIPPHVHRFVKIQSELLNRIADKYNEL